jgi:hypothetical protein
LFFWVGLPLYGVIALRLYIPFFLLFSVFSVAEGGAIDQADYDRYVDQVCADYGSKFGDGATPYRGGAGDSSRWAGLPVFEADLRSYSEAFLERLRTRPVVAARREDRGSSERVDNVSGPGSVEKVSFCSAWKQNITATVFWVGERASDISPSNERSAWDKLWMTHYGGYDTPDEVERTVWYTPKSFRPRENPFYVALPYCDLINGKFRPEAPAVIPWFWSNYRGSGISVCKDRWVGIYAHGRVAFAQWEDVGPFETDDWAYVFGPAPAPRHGFGQNAGIDISPAVRTYLGLSGVDRVSWRFVEASQVPGGPWDGWPVLASPVGTASREEVQSAQKKGQGGF